MIIQTEKENVLTSLANQERQFTISSSPKAFAVLMEGLYSNKIMAIVRELTSNAYDAHIEANVERPFEVTAPTALAPTFKIRDFGKSMDHDFVMRLYSSVFFSSKEDSNEQVGTFGLGSKSPFAYADTFNLSTYIDGIERLYSCFLNPERIPCIVLLAENPTEEPNGTLVSFDVSAKDIKDFEQSINQIVNAYWRQPPVIHNMKVTSKQPRRLDHIDVDEVYVFPIGSNVYGSNTKYYFAQGNVWYPVPTEFLSRTSATYTQLNIFDLPWNSNMCVVMDVPVGTFNVTPSRESISLDKFSIANINGFIRALQDRITEAVKTVYKPCRTRLDYNKVYRSIRGCGVAQQLIEHKYTSPYYATHAPTTLLNASLIRLYDDRYYLNKTPKNNSIPSGDLKLSELKPGFLYQPGTRANTWNTVTAVGGSSYFDWAKVRLFSGLERKLVRKASRLKNNLNRGYNQRDTEFVCFSEDLPRFVRIMGLAPEHVYSIAALPDPGAPTSTKKTQTTAVSAQPAKVWKPGEAFIVVVQYGYISVKDPHCMVKYDYAFTKERVAVGDVNSFWSYFNSNMTDAEKKLVGTINLKTVMWDAYDGDDTFHFYNKLVPVLGEDKMIEIMLRPLDLFSVDVPIEYETGAWNHTHPFKQFVGDVLEAEGYTPNTNGHRYSLVPLQKCPFGDLGAKANELAEKKKLELKAQKEAILDQYPMFRVRSRKQLIRFLEENKECITSSTSSHQTP